MFVTSSNRIITYRNLNFINEKSKTDKINFMSKNHIHIFKIFICTLLCLPLVSVKSYATNSLCTSGKFSHVIITSNAMKMDTDEYSISAFQKFRTDNGLPSTIVTTEDIYANYVGRDNPEKIRNFIKDAFANWEIKYVLLAGDVNIVPARFLYARQKQVASDMYYGCLEGDFNANNNDFWGEAGDDLDFTYDVFVGRASAENAAELSNFVYKTIKYETSPLNASYHTKMIQWNAIETGVGITSAWAKEYTSRDKDITCEYYRYTNSDPLARIVNTRLSSGNTGFYLGASHGVVGSAGNITRVAARAFTNADQFYFFTGIMCLTGRFQEDCLAEHLTTSTRTGGAFAGFFNSEEAHPPYITQFLITMRNKYLEDKITRLGDLRSAIQARYSVTEYNNDMAIRYNAYHFNLLGDPATEWKLVNSTPIDLKCDFEQVENYFCTDLSGNNNKLLLKNGALIVSGSLGNAVALDGIDDYLELPHNNWNPMGNQVELTLSVLVNAAEFKDNIGIITKGNDKQTFGLTLSNDGKVQFEINKNAPLNFISTAKWVSNSSLKLNTWHAVAVTIEYEKKELRFYIDGFLDNTVSLPDMWFMGKTDEPLYVGSNGTQGFFRGLIDNVCIYNRDMSEHEIKALNENYKTSIARNNYSSTIKLYPNPARDNISFSENILSATIYDHSGRVVLKHEGSFNTLNIATLNAGLYFVKIVNRNAETIVTKVVKE